MKALVTGGGGFLGGRIVEMLRQRGDDVTVLGRSPYPHLAAAGVTCVQGDVCDAAKVRAACAGMDVVFHVAGIPGIWGQRETYYQIHTLGTLNVIAACPAVGVPRLIYTSSPSVVMSDAPIRGADESVPYPSRYLTHYSETKALAERAVLSANNKALSTVALRPHLIFGPGDPHLMPRVIGRARRGRLIRVGDGENLVDITYLDNAARAHLQAADALRLGAACAGRAYFITNGEPVRLWEWFAAVLSAIGAPPVTRSISYKTAYRAGATLEWLYRVLGIQREPLMTRFLAGQLAHDHYFKIDAARRDFGYTVDVDMNDGTRRLIDWLRAAPILAEPRLAEPRP